MHKSISILVLALITTAVPIAPATAVDNAHSCAAEDDALRQELVASDGELTRAVLVALSNATNCTPANHVTPTSSLPLRMAEAGPCANGEDSRKEAFITLAANAEYVDSHVVEPATAYVSHQDDLDEYWAFGRVVSMYANNHNYGTITILDTYVFHDSGGVALAGCGEDHIVCSGAGSATWREKFVTLTAASAFSNCA